MKGLGERMVVRKVTGLTLQTSAVRFAEIECPVVERENVGVLPVHGVLGADLLRHCRMTLDSGRILLEQLAAKEPGR